MRRHHPIFYNCYIAEPIELWFINEGIPYLYNSFIISADYGQYLAITMKATHMVITDQFYTKDTEVIKIPEYYRSYKNGSELPTANESNGIEKSMDFTHDELMVIRSIMRRCSTSYLSL